MCCQEESDRLSRSSSVVRVVSCGYTHIRILLCASGYAHTATPCKVGDPDGGVQWLRQYLG
jgi:hypothetical protein